MTDQEKLQKLFDAALRDSTPVQKTPTRAVPQPALTQPAQPAEPIVAEKPVAPAAEVISERQHLEATPEFDKAAADELGALLDEQIKRKKRKHRMESMVLAIVLTSVTGGTGIWFVQSPERVQAFVSAIAEIRSVGDVKSMVAKYQDALKRISARGQQIDQATKAMGVTSTGDEEDPYFEAEMKQMMGGEGKTVGGRNKAMKQAFGDMQKEHGAAHKELANALDKDNSFDWEQ